jgi:hypothetical protein
MAAFASIFQPFIFDLFAKFQLTFSSILFKSHVIIWKTKTLEKLFYFEHSERILVYNTPA